ncbi:MAG TPA: hypothetical protein VFS32_02850 [Candidatus Limnocylindrales bacterium]|nr:hypothetical protein [Candidatus Limnocylindrales bacterium]
MTDLRRRRDHDGDAHALARAFAAGRVDEPLEAPDESWLDEHLAACEKCASIARGYEADRALFRSAAAPVPPRDLWARTAARLDRETTRERFVRRRLDPQRLPVGALAGALVLAVVLGAATLQRGVLPTGPRPLPSTAASASAAVPSTLSADAPLSVDREVRLLRPGADGTLGLLTATVDRVCSGATSGGCQAQTEQSGGAIEVRQHPKSVVQSPQGNQLAVVVTDPNGDSNVVIVSTPTSVPATPTPTPTPAPTPTAAPTVSPTVLPSSPGSPHPSRSPRPSPTPTGPPASSTPSPTPTLVATPSPTPPLVSPTPTSTGGTPIAIAPNLTVTGQAASYSPSGDWFAFSARPANGHQGPDIYVWHTGDARARAVTNDHRSVFSAWVGENVLGSRAEPLTAAAAAADDSTSLDLAGPEANGAALAQLASAPGFEARSVSFLLDPATAASRDLAGDGIWRPVVDPSGRYAVYWSGTIEVDASGLDWRPANGTLVLARWDPSILVAPDAAGTSAGDGSDDEPDASASAIASPSPATAVALLASAPVGDWDARWDETGTHLAVWVADAPRAELGRLTLHTVDLATGTLDAAGALITDEVAGPGYAIGEGRVAWVAPQDADSSVVKVYAWTGAKGGTAETTIQPEDTLVVH